MVKLKEDKNGNIEQVTLEICGKKMKVPVSQTEYGCLLSVDKMKLDDKSQKKLNDKVKAGGTLTADERLWVAYQERLAVAEMAAHYCNESDAREKLSFSKEELNGTVPLKQFNLENDELVLATSYTRKNLDERLERYNKYLHNNLGETLGEMSYTQFIENSEGLKNLKKSLDARETNGQGSGTKKDAQTPGSRLLKAYVLAYGDELGQKKYEELFAKAQEVISDLNKQKTSGQEGNAAPVDGKTGNAASVPEVPAPEVENKNDIVLPTAEKVREGSSPEVTNESRAPEVPTPEVPTPEAPAPEAPTPEVQPVVNEGQTKEFVAEGKKGKEQYPSLFSLFSEAFMGDSNGNSGSDELMAALFGAVILSAMGYSGGLDFLRERELQERERRLQERERELQERERQLQNGTSKVTPLASELSLASESRRAAVLTPERPLPEPTLRDVQVSEKKPHAPKTPADLAYDKIAQGKDVVTLADLRQAGVNLRTDLRPTLEALINGKPEKLGELAPKGLGDENVPVSKEFATALIARAQEREVIMRKNAFMRG